MSVVSASQGFMLIGHMFNILLMGVLLAQVYIYMVTYHNQTRQVLVKDFLCHLTLGVPCLNMLSYPVDLAYLGKITAIFAISGALTGVISGSVQLFFAWRVKILTSNIWLVAIVSVTALAAGSIGSTIEALKVGGFARFPDIKGWVILWLVGLSVSNVSLPFTFPGYKNHKTGFRGSDELVDRIIRSTVQTGVITTVCALIDLLTYLLDPTGLHLVFNLPLAKLYTNTLLSSLNSRGGWSYDSNSEWHSHTTGGIVSGAASRSKQGVRFGTTTHPEVFVTVEQHEMGDVSLQKPDLDFVDRDIKVDPSFDGSHPWKQDNQRVGHTIV
ncbi:uncharacterized protein BT62DRAFT_921140 [Guyanagaster necrorhizus]|uniref:DUF6534 domain-containing protein n=1 Tax=Guyanagaster necrorhizus TaxID=856835 RepID=A0A9P8AQW6_9AGAR|nr:uncharacterized protein BT62DRAFT_921140 [Guyanagaster necrorhizus MCA 3950]KAG7444291.1 hypothetical protein BT62DRAFT_921140 [Guyanagaster necrorhizus MCA 3950]